MGSTNMSKPLFMGLHDCSLVKIFGDLRESPGWRICTTNTVSGNPEKGACNSLTTVTKRRLFRARTIAAFGDEKNNFCDPGLIVALGYTARATVGV